MTDINVVAVLVAIVASGVLGALWYSPMLFRRPWTRAAGREPVQSPTVYTATLLSAVAAALAFGWWAGPEPDVLEAMLDGFVVGLFFAAAGLGLHYAFAGRPLTLWAIDGGFQVARFILLGLVFGLVGCAATANGQATMSWPIHSTSRPQPPVVDPGPFTASAPRPSDAVVLFDGRSLDGWRSADNANAPARWRVQDGYMEVVAGTGGIQTAQPFGDVQLHIEWMAPRPAADEGQNRGNSGVFLMGRYEVQILDSYQSTTYPDGQAAAVYGQYPPLVNASRPPGEWQSYDIVFMRPRFSADGKLLRAARVTVFHNGVLVQNDATLTGPTGHKERPPYSPHADALPISLQDHGQAVRYRNIWVRQLTAE